MATASRQTVAAQYENYAIYVLLSSRGAQPGFHWGIFMPTASPDGHVWHATNREGGWKLEHKTSANIPFSMSLVLAYKIGTVNQSAQKNCLDILNRVDASGLSSRSTGEEFSCRVWVKDAIITLHNNHIIVLNETVDAIEAKLTSRANAHKSKVESGQSAARVDNSGA